MDSPGVIMRVATAAIVLALSVLGVTRLPIRTRQTLRRGMGLAALGFAAIVFGLQSGNVGASLGGAVLALAIGAITVLLVVLFGSV